jgi:DNA helicase-2/ATP-dependent DNA helicase PcrA
MNYRSTEPVTRTVTSVAPRMGASAGMLPLELEADRGPSPQLPEIREFEMPDDEAEGIAASIQGLRAAGVELRDQAVLCRSNSRLNEISTALEQRGIPVLHLGSLFEREDVRDLLSLLSLAVDRFGDALVRVCAMPRYALSLQDVYNLNRHLRQSERRPLEALAEGHSASGLSVQGQASVQRLAADLQGIATSSSAWELLATYLLDRTDLARRFAQADTIAERMRAVAVWQFLNFVREQGLVGSGLPIQRTLDRVRQLVLLAEERDLRQVPTAALHLDAVRLMTVHGSKGLEFEAVHLPGLNVASFPASNRGQRCPPPVGMVSDTGGRSRNEEARHAHEVEEECLFFVAISRARTHLRLYACRKQKSGNNRSRSPYLAWVPGSLVREIPNPAVLPLPANVPRPTPVAITWPSDWKLTDSRLTSYEKCPRRFFYTHVLSLGGARKPTAFSRTHDCLYELLRWFADAKRSSDPTVAEAENAFEEIWRAKGPIDHAFAADYRRLVTRMIAALVDASAGRRYRELKALALDFPNGRVMVEPSELAELPDGTVVVRSVRTGHKRSDEYDRLEYTLYRLAAQAEFGSSVVVQALHLTDETSEVVAITQAKLNTRRARSQALLTGIATGQFPPEVDAVTCPRCPHFFVCAAAPPGPLALD